MDALGPLSPHITWFLLIGVLFVSMTALRRPLQRCWATTAQFQLLVGVLIGPLGIGLVRLDWIAGSKFLEVASEIAVIVSLYSAGIKMRLPLLSREWLPPILMATLSMLATIALTTGLGYYGLGLSLAFALLLAAVLAPTDPVLADEVQIEGPNDSNVLRRTLTGEAGFNDGAAFPFVLLAVGLFDPALHPLGTALWRWLSVDMLWKVVGGLIFGAGAGYGLGTLTAWFRHRRKESGAGSEELLTIGFIALVYGAALLINTYAFLAVFAAAYSLRRIEHRNETAESASAGTEDELVEEQTEVAETLEHLVQMFLVVIVGVLLSSVPEIGWDAWCFAALMIFAVRPIAVLCTLRTQQLTTKQRWLAAWFGIRGIGTIYYLSHAIELGMASDAVLLVGNCCVATIVLSVVVHGTSLVPLMKSSQA